MKNEDLGILDGGRTWFRFTGAAGNLLKNTCPGVNSCGSTGAFWSDSPLPTRVGETVNITFYESYFANNGASKCRVNDFEGRGEASRCSSERGGVVYKLYDAMTGSEDTFCGMD